MMVKHGRHVELHINGKKIPLSLRKAEQLAKELNTLLGIVTVPEVMIDHIDRKCLAENNNAFYDRIDNIVDASNMAWDNDPMKDDV